MKIDSKIKTKLLEALASGKYKFGTGMLYNRLDGCHCTLGVLADVLGLKISKNGYEIEVDGKNEAYRPFYNFVDELTVNTIYMVNDRSSSFDEMIDWVQINL